MERSGGQIGTYETKIYGTPEMEQADAYYVDRLVKFLLWSWGGFKVSICGDDNVAAAIRAAYSEGGSRAFDKGFMEQVYETEFIVESLPYDKKPEAVQRAESIGRHCTRHASASEALHVTKAERSNGCTATSNVPSPRSNSSDRSSGTSSSVMPSVTVAGTACSGYPSHVSSSE